MSVPAIQLTDVDSDGRVKDLRLAEALEFSRPRVIRELIQRNLKELQRYGDVPCRAARVRGNDADEYRLNEAQALVICMRSDASRAADCREEIIAVFMAWRNGKLAPRYSGELTLDAIRGVVREETAPIYDNVIRLNATVNFLYRRVDDLAPKRNDFPVDVRAKCIHVVKTYFDNRCPCGCRIIIIDEHGEPIKHIFTIDHYNGKERNGLEDAFPCAFKCNQELKDPEIRERRRPYFQVFQDQLSRAYAGHIKNKKAKSIAKRDEPIFPGW